MTIRYSIKKRLILAPLTLLSIVLITATSYSMNESNLIDQLNEVDAYKALALANQWHLEKQPVKSHITTNEVVFQFESGTTKTIALPEEKVMIAVAHYIKNTHQ